LNGWGWVISIVTEADISEPLSQGVKRGWNESICCSSACCTLCYLFFLMELSILDLLTATTHIQGTCSTFQLLNAFQVFFLSVIISYELLNKGFNFLYIFFILGGVWGIMLTCQKNRSFRCNSDYISTGNSSRTRSLQQGLHSINSIETSCRVVVCISFLFALYSISVVQQNCSITALKIKINKSLESQVA